MFNKKIYISIPYTGHKEISFRLTNLVAGKLLDWGSVPISPISHSHPIEEHCEKTWDWDVWQKVDYALLDFCDEILVVNFSDKAIEESVGVQDEIEYAKKNKKTIRELKVNIEFKFDLEEIKENVQ